MSAAAKLQLKPGMTIAVVRAPEELATDVTAGYATAGSGSADAVLVFAQNRDQLVAESEPLVQAARRNALAWLAYPKGGQLGTDLNRDSVASLLSSQGIRPVRQVAIDDIWSALRFRPAANINGLLGGRVREHFVATIALPPTIATNRWLWGTNVAISGAACGSATKCLFGAWVSAQRTGRCPRLRRNPRHRTVSSNRSRRAARVIRNRRSHATVRHNDRAASRD